MSNLLSAALSSDLPLHPAIVHLPIGFSTDKNKLSVWVSFKKVRSQHPPPFDRPIFFTTPTSRMNCEAQRGLCHSCISFGIDPQPIPRKAQVGVRWKNLRFMIIQVKRQRFERRRPFASCVYFQRPTKCWQEVAHTAASNVSLKDSVWVKKKTYNLLEAPEIFGQFGIQFRVLCKESRQRTVLNGPHSVYVKAAVCQ